VLDLKTRQPITRHFVKEIPITKAASEKSIVCNRATRVHLQTLQTIISTRSVIQTFLKCRKCVTHRHFSVCCLTYSVYDDY